ncbi:MAG: FlgO family outer membrane protein [Pseudomonadota bacterium]
MPDTPKNRPARYKVDNLVIDTGTRHVTVDGRPLKLGGLTFDMLLALTEAAPSFLSYDELASQVWKGRAVSPETLAQRAKLLRDALSDDAHSPRYLELVRGKGYRLIPEAERLPSAVKATSSRPLGWVAAALILVMAVVAGLQFGTSDPPDSPSLAVLPFADMSENADQKYLADGMAEELINQLAQLEGLDVASRTESFVFPAKSRDIDEIGGSLNVSAILEGSVRRSGDAIRVTVQLIDVDSGYHLWSNNYDRELADIFEIQDDIAESVAGSLGVKLGVGSINAFRGAGTRNIEAYEAYLRRDYARAVSLDPDYAVAWSAEGLRIASTMWAHSPEDAPEILERAQEHAARALVLSPGSAQVHTDYATVTYPRMKWQTALESYAKANDLHRNEYTLGHLANMLTRAGRLSDAKAIHDERTAMMRVPERNPYLAAIMHIGLRDLDSARRINQTLEPDLQPWLDLMIALNEGSNDSIRNAIADFQGNQPGVRDFHQPLSEMLDRPDDALEFIERLANDPDVMWPAKYSDTALFAAYFDAPELALNIISREVPYTAIRHGFLWWPVMSDMRQLPGFKGLVTEINLVTFWRSNGWPDYCWSTSGEDFACE